MKNIIFAILLFVLTSCLKDTTYMVKEGETQPFPYVKQYTIEQVLSINVRFHDDCRYPELRPACEGDFNKLIYFGNINPHNTGVAWVWKAEGTDRHLVLGYYLWLNKESPFANNRMGFVKSIETNVWYKLTIDTRTGVDWYVNDSLVKHYDYQINVNWITSGWYGGADNQGNDCLAPQQISYDIRKNNTI